MSDYSELFAVMRSRWVIVALGVLLGVTIAAGWSYTRPVTYTSTARILIATPIWNDMIGSGSTSGGGDSALAAATGSGDVSSSYGNQFTQQRMPTYLGVLTTPEVLDPVARHLGVSEEDLAGRVTGRLVPETVMLDISVSSDSAGGAADATNAVVTQYTKTLEHLETPSFSAASPVQPVIVAPPVPPSTASGPSVMVSIVVGGALGLLAGIGMALAMRRRSPTSGESGLLAETITPPETSSSASSPAATVTISHDVRA